MLLPLALASMLAGPPAGAEAAAPAPVEVTVETPAPAPAPAPAPIEITVETNTPNVKTVVVVQPPTATPAPLVVVSTPAPVLAPTLSPPAPTWGPVPPPVYVPPSPERVRSTMRAHRRSAIGVFALGGVGMSAAVGLQYMRVRGLQRCAAQPSISSEACLQSEVMDVAFSRYSAIGMGMFVAGTAGAGAMLGNAAATRDVQLHGGVVRPRGGLKLLGIASIAAASAWMIGANVQLFRHEAQCDDDPRCLLRYRPLRWAANDGAALGIAAGAGMLGYAVAYERQGKALMQLRAAPSIGRRSTGVAVSMAF